MYIYPWFAVSSLYASLSNIQPHIGNGNDATSRTGYMDIYSPGSVYRMKLMTVCKHIAFK